MTGTLRDELQALPARSTQPPMCSTPRAAGASTGSFTGYTNAVGIHGLAPHDPRDDAASTPTMAGTSQRASRPADDAQAPAACSRAPHDGVHAPEQATQGQTETSTPSAELAALTS